MLADLPTVAARPHRSPSRLTALKKDTGTRINIYIYYIYIYISIYICIYIGSASPRGRIARLAV